jgi:hypothetical protein
MCFEICTSLPSFFLHSTKKFLYRVFFLPVFFIWHSTKSFFTECSKKHSANHSTLVVEPISGSVYSCCVDQTSNHVAISRTVYSALLLLLSCLITSAREAKLYRPAGRVYNIQVWFIKIPKGAVFNHAAYPISNVDIVVLTKLTSILSPSSFRSIPS